MNFSLFQIFALILSVAICFEFEAQLNNQNKRRLQFNQMQPSPLFDTPRAIPLPQPPKPSQHPIPSSIVSNTNTQSNPWKAHFENADIVYHVDDNKLVEQSELIDTSVEMFSREQMINLANAVSQNIQQSKKANNITSEKASTLLASTTPSTPTQTPTSTPVVKPVIPVTPRPSSRSPKSVIPCAYQSSDQYLIEIYKIKILFPKQFFTQLLILIIVLVIFLKFILFRDFTSRNQSSEMYGQGDESIPITMNLFKARKDKGVSLLEESQTIKTIKS